jgi:hypothetical protein
MLVEVLSESIAVARFAGCNHLFVRDPRVALAKPRSTLGFMLVARFAGSDIRLRDWQTRGLRGNLFVLYLTSQRIENLTMSQSFTNLLYHIIFSTKGRRPLITLDYQPRLYD